MTEKWPSKGLFPHFEDVDAPERLGLGLRHVLLLIVLLIPAGILTTVIAVFFLGFFGSLFNPEFTHNRESLFLMVRTNTASLVNFLFYLVIFGIIYWIVVGIKKLDFLKTLRLGWPQKSYWVKYAVITGILLGIISVILNHYFPVIEEITGGGKGPVRQLLTMGITGDILIFIMTVILAPVIEEILYRGFLFSALASRLGIWISGIIVSITYVVFHFFSAGRHIPAISSICLLAIITMILRIKAGSLFPPVACHLFYNLILALVISFY